MHHSSRSTSRPLRSQRAQRARSLLAGLALSLFVVACTTPYGAMGLTGGFEERRIDASTYKVHFQGNGFTSKDTVESYTLLRCAELTRDSGYDWFLMVEGGTERDDTQVHSGSTTQSWTNGGSSSYAQTSLNSGSRSSSATTFGGGSSWSNTNSYTGPSTTTNIKKYDSSVVIKMFSGDKPEEALNGYVAEEVLTYLGPGILDKG